jgi:hypothetical protein
VAIRGWLDPFGGDVRERGGVSVRIDDGLTLERTGYAAAAGAQERRHPEMQLL